MKRWFANFRFKRGLLVIPAVILFLCLMGFVTNEQYEKTCSNIYVHIDYESDNYFVNKEEVLALMTKNNHDLLIGERVENINLKQLEQRIKSHNFVEDAEVFKDHKGNLTVKISQCRPIARIVDQYGPHAYIGENGNTLPSSEKFTARVILIDGPYSQKLKTEKFLETEEGQKYMELLKFIDADKFWKAQIYGMTVLSDGEVVFYTQIGNHAIEFGKPEEIEQKFRKLKIFYKKIVPFKGYNHYHRVSLKFKDQIVCE